MNSGILKAAIDARRETSYIVVCAHGIGHTVGSGREFLSLSDRALKASSHPFVKWLVHEPFWSWVSLPHCACLWQRVLFWQPCYRNHAIFMFFDDSGDTETSELLRYSLARRSFRSDGLQLRTHRQQRWRLRRACQRCWRQAVFRRRGKFSHYVVHLIVPLPVVVFSWVKLSVQSFCA